MGRLKTIAHKTFGHPSEWSAFEKAWLTIFTATSLTICYATGDSLLGLITSLTGMLCVVLVAKGKISNYFFGIIQTSTYGYIAYTYQLFGETMLNWCIYLPAQFLGLYLWSKHQNSSNVNVKTLTPKQWVLLTVTTLLAWAGYTALLNALGGNSTGLDSATTVLSIMAQLLMLYRFKEQWLLWIAVNILSILLWVGAISQSSGNDWSLVVMWVAFLFNSIYGWVNWGRIHRQQEVESGVQNV